MNHNAVIDLNVRRPQSRVIVYTPTCTKKSRRARRILACIDLLTCLTVTVCLAVGLIVLVGLL